MSPPLFSKPSQSGLFLVLHGSGSWSSDAAQDIGQVGRTSPLLWASQLVGGQDPLPPSPQAPRVSGLFWKMRAWARPGGLVLGG